MRYSTLYTQGESRSFSIIQYHPLTNPHTESANMSSTAPFAVKSLDHVVLTVKDYQATIDFYTKRLGMTHEKFSSKGDER